MKHFSIHSFLALSVLLAGVFGTILFSGCAENKPVSKKGKLTLTTEPSDAEIFIMGIERSFGKTPTDGAMPPGTYIFRLSLPGYETTWEKITIVENSHKSVNVKLVPLTTSVLLTSVPTGAKVEFEGKQIGTTPYVMNHLQVGEYKATISLPAYSPKQISWEIKNQRPIMVQTNLSQNVGKLKIDSAPSNASLMINGEPRGNTPFNESLEQGQYKINITKEGYQPYEQIITVNLNKQTNVSAVLDILLSDLNITSTPTGATVFVDNKPYGNTPVLLKSLQPKSYQIRVVKEGFDPATREVTITPGEKFDVDLQLDSNTGGIDMVVNPPGITVYLDGKLVGTTQPDAQQPGVSKVFTLRNLSMGEHEITVAHKRAVPNKRSLRLKVEKGKIERLPTLGMWIPDSVLTLKNGRKYTGKLLSSTNKSGTEIYFETEPGLKTSYLRAEVLSLERLEEKE